MAHPSQLPPRLLALRFAVRTLHALSPDLALRYAGRIFCTPRRHRASERETAALQRARTFHFQAGGLRLRAHVWGDGPAVALLHGWEGRGSQFHAFAGPLAEAGLSAVAFDQPAHGGSPGYQAGPGAWFQAVEAFLDTIGPIHGLVAHSLGAVGAVNALGRLWPVPRTVLIAPPSETYSFYSRLLSALGLPEDSHGPAFEAFMARHGLPSGRVRLPALAPSLTAPLLVVHDRADREVPWTCGSAIASAWPGARLLTTDGLGHRRILQEPSVIAQAVAFLSQTPPAPSLPFHGDGPRSLEWHLYRRGDRSL